MKKTQETNLMFEELAKNNYQPPFERGGGRRQGGIHEIDRISSLEEKNNFSISGCDLTVMSCFGIYVTTLI